MIGLLGAFIKNVHSYDNSNSYVIVWYVHPLNVVNLRYYFNYKTWIYGQSLINSSLFEVRYYLFGAQNSV